MQPKIIVGISGKIGTGKTTLANHLCDLIPGMVRVSFADALRQEVRECYGVPMEWMLSQEGKTRVVPGPSASALCGFFRPTVRELLQMHGVFRREMDPEYWVKKVEDTLQSPGPVVIDDVRFPNEAALVKRHGVLVRLDPYLGWTPGPNAGHISETALDDFRGFDFQVRPGFGILDDLAWMLAKWLTKRAGWTFNGDRAFCPDCSGEKGGNIK